MRLETIQDVAERQLCCGCGACAYIDPHRIRMVDTEEYGRRPLADQADGALRGTPDAMEVCPGIGLRHRFDVAASGLVPELLAGWGPVRELWEGWAGDPALRRAGSSGGVASALALHCIERGGMHGLLHIAARPDVPYLNHTVLSTTGDAILAATGSRYAPASPCDGLQTIVDAPSPCVFIGKPCDVAAAEKARRLRPDLDRKLGLSIAIFCAGTPTTKGTLALLRAMGVPSPEAVTGLRYRGNGWPGRATVTYRTPEGEQTRSLSYEESWGLLSHHQQWRCNVCADHTGEFADVAVGDPWYRPVGPDESGRSLVLVRTERGQRLVQAAREAGDLVLERVSAEVLPASQPNLLRGRGAVWGRLLALRLLGIPVPRYTGLPMFRHWWRELGLTAKVRSLAGTARRVLTRQLTERQPVRVYEPSERATACAAASRAPRTVSVGTGEE